MGSFNEIVNVHFYSTTSDFERKGKKQKVIFTFCSNPKKPFFFTNPQLYYEVVIMLKNQSLIIHLKFVRKLNTFNKFF